jgi:hypothetical protein
MWQRFVGVALALYGVAGCGPADTRALPDDAFAAPASAAQAVMGRGATSLRQELVAQGALGLSEARFLVERGRESLSAVYQTPAVVGTNDILKIVVVTDLPVPASAVARFSIGAEWSDLPGTCVALSQGAACVFDFGTHAAGTEITTALYLNMPSGQEFWLNNGGDDYRTQVRVAGPLGWVGGLTARQDGFWRTLPGEALFVGHDLSVQVETYPLLPSLDVVLHYTVDRASQSTDVPMQAEAIGVGAFGNNGAWSAVIPAAGLARGATLTFWVEAKSPQNTLWDSRQGANYVTTVSQDAPKPAWAGVGTIYPRRNGPPVFHSDLQDPVTCGGCQAFYAGAPDNPGAEVWIPGVTDRDDVELLAKGGFIRAEVWTPLYSGSATGVWSATPLRYFGKNGNNAVFEWHLFAVDEITGTQYACIDWPADVPDGDYPYKFRFSTDGGSSWRWLGADSAYGRRNNRTVRWTDPRPGF